jgi:lipid A 3-O-deacylase
MRGVNKYLMTLIATSLFALPAVAASQDQNWTLNLYLENDIFSNRDEGYTSGLRAAWVSPDVTDYLEDPTLPAWIRSINQRLTFFHKTRQGLQRNVTFSVGQTLYTPVDDRRSDLILEDRPYAGWLFASLGYQTRNDRELDTLEVRLGIVGPGALGQQSQDFIHKIRGIDRFLGWDNQLSNELGAVFLWEHKRKFTYIYHPNSRFGFDVIGHSGIALGNVATYLNAGGEVRLGWAIPDDFGTSAIRPGGDNSTPNSSWDPRLLGDPGWGAHIFVSFDTRLVGHDIFLDGNTFKDSHSVDRRLLVSDAAVGFSFIYGAVKLSYAQIYRSREFYGQQRTPSYGSLAFSYSLPR